MTADATIVLGKMLGRISKSLLKTVSVNTNRNVILWFYYSSQYLSVKQRKYHMAGENCPIRSFKNCTPCRYYSHKQITEDEKCMACGTYEGEVRYIWGFGGET